MIRTLAAAVSFLLLATLASAASEDWTDKVDPEILDEIRDSGVRPLAGPEMVDVVVWTESRGDYDRVSIVGEVRNEFESIPAIAMQVPVSRIDELARMGYVEKIQLDRPVSALRLESIVIVKADAAESSFLVNGTGINISIVDTGIFNHSDFQSPSRIAAQKCFISHGVSKCPPSNSDEGDNATDDYPDRHGTYVAGIAAGKDGSFGRGIARNSTILAVKALNATGHGKDSDIAKAIEWSYLNGAKVISLSLGGSGGECYDYLDSTFVDLAVANGTVVVVAAGNSGPGDRTIEAPGCAKGAITVGASDDSDAVAGFSSRGSTSDNRTKPDLLAPGVNIESTFNETHSLEASGTSASAPHVSGAAALIVQRYNQINNEFPKPMLVKAVLLASANVTGNERNSTYGSGRLDINRSLQIINNTRNDTLNQGGSKKYKIAASQGINVALVWFENSTTRNNLDLVLQSPSGLNYTQASDANDTVEHYINRSAEAGDWIAYVNGTSVSGAQEYFIASTGEIDKDSSAPNITVSLSTNFTAVNTSLNISFNVTDEAFLHLNLTVMKPDGSKNTTTYTTNATHDFTNTTEPGFYIVELAAIDNATNAATSKTNFTVFKTVSFNQTMNSSSGVPQNYTMAFKNAITSETMSTLNSSDGRISGTFNATGLMNLELNYSDNTITIFNTTIDSDKLLNFTLESPSVSISGTDLILKTFASNMSLDLAKVAVKLNYSGTGFTDESRIAMYKCSDFSFETDTCNGSYNTSTGSTRNETEDTITMESNSFSAYVAVQESAPAAPSSSSDSGKKSSGGGGGRTSKVVVNKTSQINRTDSHVQPTQVKSSNSSTANSTSNATGNPTAEAKETGLTGGFVFAFIGFLQRILDALFG